jgi:microcystin degradation protein MlrC
MDERVLDLAGADLVIITLPQCRARGHEVCEFLVKWAAPAGLVQPSF